MDPFEELNDPNKCGIQYEAWETCLGENDRKFAACTKEMKAFRQCFEQLQTREHGVVMNPIKPAEPK